MFGVVLPPRGAYAEYVAVPQDWAALIPPGHDERAAAARRGGLGDQPDADRFGVYATDEITVTPEQYDAHLPDIDLTAREPVS